MPRERINTIRFNCISEELSESEVNDLKNWYRMCYKRSWCFNELCKKLKIKKVAINAGIAIFSTGGLISDVATSGIPLLLISMFGVVLKS